MGEHRRAAARGDQRDGLLRAERARVDVGRAARQRAGGRRPPARRDVPGVDERRRRCAAGRRGPCARRATSSHATGVAELVEALDDALVAACRGTSAIARDARRERLGGWPPAGTPSRCIEPDGGRTESSVPGTKRTPSRSAAASGLGAARRACRGRSARARRRRARARARRARRATAPRRRPSSGSGGRSGGLDGGSRVSSNALIVSDRSPRRSVSSGMTSSGGMLPRLTSGAELADEPGLLRLLRRLEEQVARPAISWTISSIRPLRTSPVPRKMPAVPDSRASVMTFQAPAASSSRIHSTHW